METQQKAKCITLKGSAELVKKYLHYGINSILYQRGIYPPETFEPAEHFGLFILMSTDDKIKSFLDTVLSQVEDWLLQRKVQQVTLVITNVNTKEVLEKWDFKVDYEGKAETAADSNGTPALPEVGTKDVQTIQKEIREVIRQITGTVSFLPLLDCLCSFDILTYTVPNCGIPKEWDETQPVFIANSQEVQLRSFSTSIHKMDTIEQFPWILGLHGGGVNSQKAGSPPVVTVGSLELLRTIKFILARARNSSPSLLARRLANFLQQQPFDVLSSDAVCYTYPRVYSSSYSDSVEESTLSV